MQIMSYFKKNQSDIIFYEDSIALCKIRKSDVFCLFLFLFHENEAMVSSLKMNKTVTVAFAQ